MHKRKLCQHCEIGKQTYELDSKSTECPYLLCHNGKKCRMYERLNNPKNTGILKGVANWLKVNPPPKK